MKHFEIAEWSDFVRGLVTEERGEAMRSHLAAGCRKCQRTAEILGRVARFAAAESHYEVPEYAVHCARSIYAMEQPREVRVPGGLLCRLVFDSFREPLPAGVRSQHRISRQTLYEAGDYTLDLRQEQERGSALVCVVGQIASRKEPGRAFAGVPVALFSGASLLAQSVSNEFGEFQMEYAPARDLRLDVGVAPEHRRTSGHSQSGEPGGFE